MINITIPFQRLSNAAGLNLPAYASDGAAGLDLEAANVQPILIDPGMRSLIPTGFAIAIPQGYKAQIRPRSGLAKKHGITVANAPGTIDSDYRGEISVLLINLGAESFTVSRGMRIAQMIIAQVTIVRPIEKKVLDQTARSDGGFGSTGL